MILHNDLTVINLKRYVRVAPLRNCPGSVLTPMNGNAQDDSIVQALDDPEYRGGLTAQQVAEVALFLLSRRTASIKGHAQVADAGYAAAFPPFDT